MNKRVIVFSLLFFLLLSTISASAYSIDECKIKIQESGGNTVTCEYTLSWWDKVLLWIKGVLGENKEKELEKIIENELEVELTSFTVGDDLEFSIKEYSGKVSREGGTWYYTTDGLKESAFKRINLERVYVIFPDGFIMDYEDKLPANLKHLEDENLAMLYSEAKSAKGIYEALYQQYKKETNIVKIPEEFVAKIDLELIKMVATSPFSTKYPLLEFQSLLNLATGVKSGMREYNNILDNIAETGFEWGKQEPYQLKDKLKEMSELKEKEANLIRKITSSFQEDQEFRKKNKQKLINNLESQKEVLKDIKGYAIELHISEDDPQKLKELKKSVNEIIRKTRELTILEQEYIKQGLKKLKSK